MEYRRKLREKWGNEKGVREIERQRRLPSNIKNAAALKKTMLDARKTKDDNRRRHTREGLTKPTAERKSAYGLEACANRRRLADLSRRFCRGHGHRATLDLLSDSGFAFLYCYSLYRSDLLRLCTSHLYYGIARCGISSCINGLSRASEESTRRPGPRGRPSAAVAMTRQTNLEQLQHLLISSIKSKTVHPLTFLHRPLQTSNPRNQRPLTNTYSNT